MRRLVPPALATLVLLTGCGAERPAQVRDADASFSPRPQSPTPTSTPTPTPTPTPAPTPSPTSTARPDAAGGRLAGFPLDLDYARENGDDQSPVVVTSKPGVRALDLCGKVAWDPAAGTTDVIGVQWDGEAEWSRARTLVLYPTPEAASSAVDTLRDVVTNCPVGHGNEYGYPEHTLVNYYEGDQSVGWIDRYWSSDVQGFDTGLTVFHAARVGRAVLVSSEYGEGNGSVVTRQEAIAAAAKGDQYVVDAMAERF